MERQKITMVNGELCRVSDRRRNEIGDGHPLLPFSNNSIQEDNSSCNWLGISVFTWILFSCWILIAILSFFFKSSILEICFHILTFFISLIIGEFARIFLARMFTKNNFDEFERLKAYSSLDPRMLISSHDYLSLIIMAFTFIILGMPMLSINQVVDYEKLPSNWKKSLVAFSGPFSYFLFGGFLAIVRNVGIVVFQESFFKGSISNSLFSGISLLAFLVVINILPFPPITDGFRMISPYLPERVNSEIANARKTLIFFVFCTILFLFIAQSGFVKEIVQFIVVKIYSTTQVYNNIKII